MVVYGASEQWGIIIGKDSNCHSVIYELETNIRGEKLEEFLADTGLMVEVVEKIEKDSNYKCRGNNSISITLSKDLCYDILEWKVDRDYNASNNNTILFKIGKEQITLLKTWKWHKADWLKFGEILRSYKSALPKRICEKVSFWYVTEGLQMGFCSSKGCHS